MAGHASRWVGVSLLVVASACGRSNATDDAAFGGQPATGGVSANSGGASNGGDSRGGRTTAQTGGTVNGSEHGGASAHGGSAEAGAPISGGTSSGGSASGGSASGGTSNGGVVSEGGSAGELPIEYRTCCYIGANFRIFITKLDPNTGLCINVSLIEQVSPTQPMGMDSEIHLPERFRYERARATYVEPGNTCTRQLVTNDSRAATSARGTVSFDPMLNCMDKGVSGDLVFTFEGIEGEQTLTFQSSEQSCL